MHKIRFNGKEFENVQTALNEVVFEHYPIEIENDNEKKICKSYSEAEEFILKNDSNSK